MPLELNTLMDEIPRLAEKLEKKITVKPPPPELPDRFEAQHKAKTPTVESDPDDYANFFSNLEKEIEARQKEKATNKRRAEKLIINGTLKKHAQPKVPTAQTVNHAREELILNKASFLKWIGLQDKPYIEQVQSFIEDAEKRAATLIQRTYRKTASKPALSAEQRNLIKQEITAARLQTQQARTRLGYETKLANGVEFDSDASGWWNILRLGEKGGHPGINQDTISVHRLNDSLLQSHLQQVEADLATDPALQKLKTVFENKGLIQSPKEEIEALHELLELVNKPFSKVSPDHAIKISEQLKEQLNKNNSFTHQFGLKKQFGKIEIPLSDAELKVYNIVNPKVPLGTFLEAGSGVCRHRSIWLKLLVDDFSKWGPEASLEYGWFAKEAHAWTQVRFPSGREYLVDPMHNRFFDLSDPNAIKEVQKLYKKRG